MSGLTPSRSSIRFNLREKFGEKSPKSPRIEENSSKLDKVKETIPWGLVLRALKRVMTLFRVCTTCGRCPPFLPKGPLGPHAGFPDREEGGGVEVGEREADPEICQKRVKIVSNYKNNVKNSIPYLIKLCGLPPV